MEVTNHGPGHAYEVQVADVFPAGVTAYRYEPQVISGTVIFLPQLDGGSSFTRDIPYLAVNESKMIDVFVQLQT